jgi:putative spermidine/putrescine transport system ATP-binding protein
MAYLELKDVRKTFKSQIALHGLSLRVERGELMCLLGPSGCGKTTTLRIIAGLESADSGGVRLDGEEISGVPPQKRDVGVVFQSYALFPHLTVNQNVGFGLKMRGKPGDEAERSVRDALKVVRLEGVGERLPRQLSGGQQQRVALARAIAIRPRLLLLDEPLSNLDAKLREEMREEIRRIQREVGITTMFVTHDQVEALALADRLAVMDHGLLMQVDSPVSVYERPSHPFVASFFGQANLLRGRVTARDGALASVAVLPGLAVIGMAGAATNGNAVVAVVKNERMMMSRHRPLSSANVHEVKVESRTFLGATLHYRCSKGDQRFEVSQPNRPDAERFTAGEAAFLSWQAEDCLILPDR